MSSSPVRAEHVFKGEFSAEKYQSSNPISRYLVNNFLSTLLGMVRRTGAKEAHEIGCGEGQITGLLRREGLAVRGCDFSTAALKVAERNAAEAGLDIPYAQKDIYQLDPARDGAELVLCCEVLEHLTDPAAAMESLAKITRKDLIVSVPREPIWHILNMARGKHLVALGNTPGHYNHWSTRSFVDFVSRYGDVQLVRTPLPWTIVHCRPRS
jgi:2-polyprenyl-3-methyl-5-hydroxy-6-metoxy-1,4-benzoquinol methylase